MFSLRKNKKIKIIATGIVICLFICSCSDGVSETGDAEIPEEDVIVSENESTDDETAVRSLEELIEDNRLIIEGSTNGFEAGTECEDEQINEIASFLSEENASPVYSDTEFTYYPLGENAFEAIEEKLRAAEDYVFIEFFIVKEGSLWDEIHEILLEKISQGVEVRMLVDGYSARWFLPEDFSENLRQEGIKIYTASPINGGSDIMSVMKDHRKMVIVDGKCVFTGGVNLADEYVNRIDLYGHWKDNAILLEGECVKSFVLMFLQMWELFGEETEYDRYLTSCEKHESTGDYCLPYFDTPLDDQLTGREVYMSILRNSTEEVSIAVPYYVPDDEFEELMIETAERGVHITILLPGIQDWPIVQLAARTYYRKLVAAGVDVYEYTPGFVHQKVFICDGCRCTVGSVNLDHRSLDGQYECGVYMYSPDFAKVLDDDFKDMLSVSTHMTTELMDELEIEDGDGSKLREFAKMF